MPWGNTAGIQVPYPYSNAGAIPADIFRLGIEYFPNRCPLLYHLSKMPLNALTFYMNSDAFRPRTATLNAAHDSSNSTTLTLVDATGIDVGDVVEIDSERLLVTAVNNGTTITVTNAYEGTSAVNHNNGSTVTIITSAATGAEVDKNALSMLPAMVAQYAQTCQKAYQVGGALASTGNFMDGQIAPLDRDRMMALQHVMDDFERACYLGKGAALSSTVTRQTMKGLKTLCTTNNVTSPTNLSAYKPSDFTRDTLYACFAQGGEPNMLFVSKEFLTGLQTWGYTLQQVQVGATALGIQPTVFNVSWLGGVQIIPAPLLPAYTAFAINTREVKLRIKRPLDDYPRGRRGDAIEGDMIMEGAIEVENQSHQAWVQGITGFAVQS
jgi:hypothetical protein